MSQGSEQTVIDSPDGLFSISSPLPLLLEVPLSIQPVTQGNPGLPSAPGGECVCVLCLVTSVVPDSLQCYGL